MKWLFWSNTSAHTLYMIWLVTQYKCPAVLLTLPVFTQDYLLLGSLLYLLYPRAIQLSAQIETTSMDALVCYSAFTSHACNLQRTDPSLNEWVWSMTACQVHYRLNFKLQWGSDWEFFSTLRFQICIFGLVTGKHCQNNFCCFVSLTFPYIHAAQRCFPPILKVTFIFEADANLSSSRDNEKFLAVWNTKLAPLISELSSES